MNEPSGRRVLITRLGSIGDCVLTLPLACAIKQQDPDAFVSWVVDEPCQQLLSGHRAVDELIVLPCGWPKQLGALAKLRKQLQALRCNIALDPQGRLANGILGLLSAAPSRISLIDNPRRRIAEWLSTERIATTASHVVDRILQLLPALGLEIQQPTFDLPADIESETIVAEFIRKSHLGCGFVILHPGAPWPSRRWSPRRFARVARHLGERHRIPSLVTWSGDQEREWSQQIVDRSGGHAILAAPTRIGEFAALMRQAHFFVGGDSDSLHLAAAVGLPCIGLYGPTRPQVSGAYGAMHLAVQAFYQAGKRHSRKTSNTAMNAIDADRVIEACEGMIERRSVSADRDAA